MSELNINEIFYSLQGESAFSGLPTVFIRLTGCPLRCGYCDTTYAFKGKNMLTIEQIIAKIVPYQTPYVCVTGGEPLAQNNCYDLLDSLALADYKVSLETSGSIDIVAVNAKVSIIMDLKTPSSGEKNNNKYTNIPLLKPKDSVKFVIGNRADFDWSMEKITQYQFNCEVLFSPVQESLNPTQLADWILDAQLNVRMQVQLHKLLWGDVAGK